MGIFNFGRHDGEISKHDDPKKAEAPLDKNAISVGEPLSPDTEILKMEKDELNVDYAHLIEEIIPELQAMLGRGVDETDRQIALDTLESTREVLVLTPKERVQKIFEAINLGRLDKAA